MSRSLSLLAVAALLAQPCIAAVTFDWAYVGNAGNAGELFENVRLGPTLIGDVAYNYAIAKTEVTNAQYTAFLNAVAATDSFALYNASMSSDMRGGITRSGASGSYTYVTKPNMANKPVNYVSFLDAMRFTNWLHNGQGNGNTETGAYTIGDGVNEVRSVDAKFWIPSEDEWYKAAYHDANAGTAEVYFDYATGSDSVPIIGTANSVGDISNPGVGVVNYHNGADWNGQNGNVTTVGAAGLASGSSYGTFDQTGNVSEWNADVLNFGGRRFRGMRGGSWNTPPVSNDLRAEGRGFLDASDSNNETGFRVATLPEPAALALAAMLFSALGFVRR